MTEALELAERARALGSPVREALKVLKQARRAFQAGDYRSAMELANRAIESCGYPVPNESAPATWNATPQAMGGSAPPAIPGLDRSTTLDRMTYALETAKRARDRGINVHEARAALRRARDAFERGDYRTAMEEANRVIESCQPSR